MILHQSNTLVHRFCSMAVAFLLASVVVLTAQPAVNAKTLDASSGAPVNVPAVILYVNCTDVIQNTASVDWYYVRLDGTYGMRTATFANGGLTYNTGAPTVQFYNVSIDYQSSDSVYEFKLNGYSPIDVDIYAGTWGRDARNGNIYSTVQC